MAIAENIRTRVRDWLILAGIAILVAGAVMLGRAYDRDLRRELIKQAIPDPAYSLGQLNPHKWEIHTPDGKFIGNIYQGEGKGYNGPVIVALRQDSLGRILAVVPLQHYETRSYFQKLEKQGFFDQFRGLEPEKLLMTETADLVSGATISSRAIYQGALEAYAKGERLALPSTGFKFGLLEATIVLLLLLGLILKKQQMAGWRKYLLWTSWMLSLGIIGFIFNAPITLSRIAAFSSGYLPDISSDLAVYLLLGGSIILFMVSGKNTYCHSVCPFGAAQEILAKIGNARTWRPSWIRTWKWVQWGSALAVLLIALSRSNPSLAQYEVFGALFKLTGSTVLFVAMILVVVLSLFIKRPWCRFFCPIDGFFAWLRLFRKKLSGLFIPGDYWVKMQNETFKKNHSTRTNRSGGAGTGRICSCFLHVQHASPGHSV